MITTIAPTPRWFPLKYHKLQYEAYTCGKKFVNLACGRGSGKTELARRRVVRALPVPKPWPNPIYFYVLPTQAQAKRVAWHDLLSLIPKEWIAAINVQDNAIHTVFGSSLYVLGADKPERLEGVQWDGGIIDEACDHRPKTFELSLMPALIHRCEFCWRIGVPKRQGAGATEYKDWYNRGLQGLDPDIWSASWPSTDILSEEALDVFRRTLDPSDFREQLMANWLSATGGVFVEFDEDLTVNSQVEYNEHYPVWVGCDFNVDPMCWTLSHEVQGQLHTFDEVVLKGTTTQRTLDALYEKYKAHPAGWNFVGDAASRHRSTTSDLTDYLIISNDARFGDKGIIFPNSNPSLSSRYSTCNAALRNAAGQRRAFINPRCKQLIRDLTQLAYKPNTTEVEHSDKTLGHASDGWGYKVMELLPIPVDIFGAEDIHTIAIA